jgi:hypothetical protein
MTSEVERVTLVNATLYAEPATDSETVSELIYNETVRIEARDGDWCRIVCQHDDYPGWIRSEALAPVPAAQPVLERRICLAKQAPAYDSPDGTAPGMHVSYGTPVDIVERTGSRVRDINGLWFSETDVLPPDSARALGEEARKFLDIPYVWGGRSDLGIDCSGLIQQCCRSRGLEIQRDTSQQVHTVGTAIGSPDRHRPVRDDIVYLPGHVAIALDADTAIHADGLAMHVRIDPLEKIFADRNKTFDQGLIRRL